MTAPVVVSSEIPMRALWMLSAFWIVFASLTTHIRAADTTDLLDSARLLVSQLRPDRNEYAYDNIHIKWKGEEGASDYEARCDCSGLVTLLLEHVRGLTAKDFKKWMGHSRPVARVYHDTIEAENGFKLIRQIAQIRPGDIIAVKYLEAAKDTGHVMIVAQAPRLRRESEPLEPGTQQWEVTIIDSSKSGHGPNDTRRNPDKTYRTGIGEGTIRLYSTAGGEIVGYTWSTLAKSQFYGPNKHHLVVGRLDAEFKP